MSRKSKAQFFSFLVFFLYIKYIWDEQVIGCFGYFEFTYFPLGVCGFEQTAEL